MSKWYDNWLIPKDSITVVPMEKPVSFKEAMRHCYSFLTESKSFSDFCTEEDCEMIPFEKVANDIKNSNSEDDCTGDIRNAIDYLENNYTRSESFKNLPNSKKEFLKEHNYDILIDNDMKYIKEAESVGVIPILYGDDPNYDGLQTDDWKDIPILVKKCVKSR